MTETENKISDFPLKSVTLWQICERKFKFQNKIGPPLSENSKISDNLKMIVWKIIMKNTRSIVQVNNYIHNTLWK